MQTDWMICVCGGLGSDQTEKLQDSLRRFFPNALVWSPSGWDDYSKDFVSAISIYPTAKLALIGHSLGCDTMIYTAQMLGRIALSVDYLAVIEPVWSDKVITNCKSVRWLQRSEAIGFPKADVISYPRTIIASTTHNSICRSSQTIALISKDINGIA